MIQEDFLPLLGTDYIELYVGNSKQAAHYYQSAFGFKLIAYAGPETGIKDKTSYVLQQSKATFVLTTPLYQNNPIADHISKHGDGVKAMQKIGDKLLDDSFKTALGGPSRDYAESSSNISFAFGLALILIYLVLAAQFESFKDPFTIMLTVPLALAGALLSLYWFDCTINIFSQIGMIMLIGLVTKNGILIVEFANKKQEEGLTKKEAALEAAAQRLRPILMTSLATALGALPIALSLGAAATSRVPLGIVVVGGLLFSLILTLFVIPCIYIFIAKKHTSPKAI